MKKKWWLVVAILAVAVVAVPVGLQAWRQAHSPDRFIDREHYHRIKKGMTQDEVEAILGVPPGVYSNKRIRYPILYHVWAEPLHKRVESWTGDEGIVEVTFDGQDTVVSMSFDEGLEVHHPSYLQQVLDWLRPSTPPPSVPRLTPTTRPDTPPSSS
jgi:hypothetical protein